MAPLPQPLSFLFCKVSLSLKLECTNSEPLLPKFPSGTAAVTMTLRVRGGHYWESHRHPGRLRMSSTPPPPEGLALRGCLRKIMTASQTSHDCKQIIKFSLELLITDKYAFEWKKNTERPCWSKVLIDSCLGARSDRGFLSSFCLCVLDFLQQISFKVFLGFLFFKKLFGR